MQDKMGGYSTYRPLASTTRHTLLKQSKVNTVDVLTNICWPTHALDIAKLTNRSRRDDHLPLKTTVIEQKPAKTCQDDVSVGFVKAGFG